MHRFSPIRLDITFQVYLRCSMMSADVDRGLNGGLFDAPISIVKFFVKPLPSALILPEMTLSAAGPSMQLLSIIPAARFRSALLRTSVPVSASRESLSVHLVGTEASSGQ